jgi:hypothetical protein
MPAGSGTGKASTDNGGSQDGGGDDVSYSPTSSEAGGSPAIPGSDAEGTSTAIDAGPELFDAGPCEGFRGSTTATNFCVEVYGGNASGLSPQHCPATFVDGDVTEKALATCLLPEYGPGVCLFYVYYGSDPNTNCQTFNSGSCSPFACL